MSRPIQHIYDTPTLAVRPGTPIGDSFGGGDTRLRLTLDMPPVDKMATPWTSLATTFRLVVILGVESVTLAGGKVLRQGPRVAQIAPAYAQKQRG